MDEIYKKFGNLEIKKHNANKFSIYQHFKDEDGEDDLELLVSLEFRSPEQPVGLINEVLLAVILDRLLDQEH